MKKETKQTYKERLIKVLVHIQDNLSEPAGLEELARIAGFSAFHFHRIFSGMVGESLIQYVRRLRLERAALQLASGDKKVIQIALDSGYETHESFTRAFKAMFKVSPSAYRKSKKAAVQKVKDFETLLRTTKEGIFEMEVKIENRDPMQVAFVRHVGPYDQCGKAWETLCGYAAKSQQVKITGPFMGVCYDDPEVTPEDKIRYDASLPADKDFKGQGEIGSQEIAGGRYAVVTHKGSYSKLKDTYKTLFGQWMPTSGYEVRDGAPSLEVYLNCPDSTPEDQLLTEICIPLED